MIAAHMLGRRSRLLILIGLGVLCACSSASPDPSSGTGGDASARISDGLARKLTVERYQHLFSGRYRRTAEGTYEEFPPLKEESFVVEEEGDVLVVTRAPLRGYHVQARVAKTGAWVELVNVGYAKH